MYFYLPQIHLSTGASVISKGWTLKKVCSSASWSSIRVKRFINKWKVWLMTWIYSSIIPYLNHAFVSWKVSRHLCHTITGYVNEWKIIGMSLFYKMKILWITCLYSHNQKWNGNTHTTLLELIFYYTVRRKYR
jgi:hypothetical protein